jgi:hypothetical protein
MSSDPTTRPPNFDSVARIYRWAEYLTLGPLLQRTRTHFLPRLLHCRQALVLGDGDGRFLARLFQQNPNLQAVAVDTSSTMLQLLAQRCPTAQTVRADAMTFIEAFASPHLNNNEASPHFTPPEASPQFTHPEASPRFTHPEASPQFRYPEASASGFISPGENGGALAPDLIVTHFFLDCLDQPEVDRLALRLATVRPGTLWILSDFGPPSPTLLKPLAALYIRALYLAFRILAGLRTHHLPNPQSSLACAGFTRIARHERLFGLIYTELWQRQ